MDRIYSDPLAVLIPESDAPTYLTAYILGCQPELSKKFSRVGMSQTSSQEEPDNVNYYDWDHAVEALRAANDGEVPRHLWLGAICAASEQATLAAKQDGIQLPLKPPKHFKELSEDEWGLIAEYYR